MDTPHDLLWLKKRTLTFAENDNNNNSSSHTTSIESILVLSPAFWLRRVSIFEVQLPPTAGNGMKSVQPIFYKQM